MMSGVSSNLEKKGRREEDLQETDERKKNIQRVDVLV
jgi:hypothetical protein